MEQEEFETRVLVELCNINEKISQLLQRKLVQEQLVQPAINQQQNNLMNHGFQQPVKKTMYNAICSSCGQECQVPFKPNPNSKVRCRTCYARGL